ncbi:MAG: WecB/TagA/CpsF family glycosyltransferase, partial [Chloroflexi bacterium]|nr:WecB/TagA/CpsF family glycosyltransferase [Chloroflexota bacterium]
INMDLVLREIERWIVERERQYVCACPVFTVMECRRDARLRTIVNRAGLATPDGMPLVWLARRQGFRQVSRVYGPDLILALCQLSAQKGYSNFFYGGAAGVAQELAQTMARRFPGLRIAGTHCPAFRPAKTLEEPAVIEKINATKPDIIWVGLGSPKQDWWVAQHRPLLDAPVLIAIGAAFDFLTGRVAQAPDWMQARGLEWFFRLAQEPRRLWRRYLINNPLFIAYILMQSTGLRKFETDW